MIDWDAWRAAYRSTSFAEQQAFYGDASKQHPIQCDFNAYAVADFLSGAGVASVVEVGGWDGELAAVTLPRFPSITRWRNLEICPGLTPVPDDPRYEHVVLDDWPWHKPLIAGALILSHSAEHMLAHELDALLARFSGRHVYLDVPVGDEPSDWAGYTGTHILEVGWNGLGGILRSHRLAWSGGSGETIRWYSR